MLRSGRVHATTWHRFAVYIMRFGLLQCHAGGDVVLHMPAVCFREEQQHWVGRVLRQGHVPGLSQRHQLHRLPRFRKFRLWVERVLWKGLLSGVSVRQLLHKVPGRPLQWQGLVDLLPSRHVPLWAGKQVVHPLCCGKVWARYWSPAVFRCELPHVRGRHVSGHSGVTQLQDVPCRFANT